MRFRFYGQRVITATTELPLSRGTAKDTVGLNIKLRKRAREHTELILSLLELRDCKIYFNNTVRCVLRVAQRERLDERVKMKSNFLSRKSESLRLCETTENSGEIRFILERTRNVCFVLFLSVALCSRSLFPFTHSFLAHTIVYLCACSFFRGNVSRQGVLDTFIPYISLTRTFREYFAHEELFPSPAEKNQATNVLLNYVTLSISFISRRTNIRFGSAAREIPVLLCARDILPIHVG